MCPKYTVKSGDILFDISKKLGVTQGARWGSARVQQLVLLQPRSRRSCCVLSPGPSPAPSCPALPHIASLAEDLEAASKACRVNTTNLQIGMELCLPGYDPANCKFVVQTGASRAALGATVGCMRGPQCCSAP